jgi:hypothetical protein
MPNAFTKHRIDEPKVVAELERILAEPQHHQNVRIGHESRAKGMREWMNLRRDRDGFFVRGAQCGKQYLMACEMLEVSGTTQFVFQFREVAESLGLVG